MRNLLLALFVFSIGYAQQPEVVSVKTDERVFKGFVGTYPITMSLKVNTFSKDHDSIYSVKGWYVYDNKQIKIPLVGIYDGDLTLYNLPSAETQNEILSVCESWYGNLWDKLDQLKMADTFDWDETFTFSDSVATQSHECTGEWKKGGTGIMEAKLLSPKGLRIYEEQEYLAFPDSHLTSFDLRNLDIFETGFTFESWRKGKDEIRVLLHYSRHSRPNQMGMCGGSYESGFVVLHFSRDLQFLSFEKTQIESCLDSIYGELNDKNAEIYTVTDGNRQKKKLRIDRKKAKIITLSP